MQHFEEWLTENHPEVLEEKKKWIQGAVNPEHKGFCTPLSKKTCAPRRKALAKRFKHGDIHADNEKKDE